LKKNKIISAFIAMAIMTSSIFTPVMAAEEVNVKIDGVLQPIASSDIINKDGCILINTKALANILGAEYNWNNSSRRVTLEKDDKKVAINVDRSEIDIKDGDERKEDVLPVNVEIDGNNIFIPLVVVCEVFSESTQWETGTNILSLETKKGKYDLLTVDIPDSSEAKIYTFEEALEMAKKKSSTLKTLSDTSDYLGELRSDLGDNIKMVNNAESVLNSFEPGEDATYDDYVNYQLKLMDNIETSIQLIRNINNVDTQKSLIKVNEQMAVDGIEIQLRSYITNIRNSNMQKELLEETIKLGEENIKNMELKHSLGLESEYNLTTAKNTQKTNESNLETLKLNIENQKQELKTLLGVDAKEDIYVEYDVDFDTLNDIDLEVFITKKVESDPSIQILKADVTDAEYVVRTNVAYSSESTLKVNNDLKSAQRALKDAQDQMEKNIRTTYNNLKQLEENDKSLNLALEQAKIDYNTTVTRYMAGKATIYQVNTARLAILSAEKNLEENKLNYETLSYSFERPYLLGASK